MKFVYTLVLQPKHKINGKDIDFDEFSDKLDEVIKHEFLDDFNIEMVGIPSVDK